MDSQLTQLAKSDRNPSQETQYRQLLAQSGQPYFQGGNGTQSSAMPWNSGGGSNNSSDAQAVTDATNKANTNFSDLLGTDKQSITDFLGKYATDTQNAVTNANNTFKIPQQVGTVNALNNRINDLQFNTGNTGQGGYSSSGQVDAALNSRYLPAQNAAISNLNTAEGAAQNQEQISLAPDVAQQNLLGTNITVGMSGLTATQASILTALVAKLDAGVSLTNTQTQTAENLAAQTLSSAASIQAARIGQQYQSLYPGQKLYSVNGNQPATQIASAVPTGLGSGTSTASIYNSGGNTQSSPSASASSVVNPYIDKYLASLGI